MKRFYQHGAIAGILLTTLLVSSSPAALADSLSMGLATPGMSLYLGTPPAYVVAPPVVYGPPAPAYYAPPPRVVYYRPRPEWHPGPPPWAHPRRWHGPRWRDHDDNDWRGWDR